MLYQFNLINNKKQNTLNRKSYCFKSPMIDLLPSLKHTQPIPNGLFPNDPTMYLRVERNSEISKESWVQQTVKQACILNFFFG